jgi:hypothetical protein
MCLACKRCDGLEVRYVGRQGCCAVSAAPTGQKTVVVLPLIFTNYIAPKAGAQRMLPGAWPGAALIMLANSQHLGPNTNPLVSIIVPVQMARPSTDGSNSLCLCASRPTGWVSHQGRGTASPAAMAVCRSVPTCDAGSKLHLE